MRSEEFLERRHGGRSGQEQREADNEDGGLVSSNGVTMHSLSLSLSLSLSRSLTHTHTQSLAQYVESHDTILLKRTLQDKTKCLLFKHFISIQAPEGTAPANNVDFWLEVQRFKVSV